MDCRAVRWEELRDWPQLQAARVQLLQQGIEQGHLAIVQLMLELHPSLLKRCARYLMQLHGAQHKLLCMWHASNLSYNLLVFSHWHYLSCFCFANR